MAVNRYFLKLVLVGLIIHSFHVKSLAQSSPGLLLTNVPRVVCFAIELSGGSYMFCALPKHISRVNGPGHVAPLQARRTAITENKETLALQKMCSNSLCTRILQIFLFMISSAVAGKRDEENQVS